LALGADDYYAISDPATFEDLANTFDLTLNTLSASLDLDAYLGLLAFDGTLVNRAPRPSSCPICDRVRQPPEVRKLLDRRHP
jgi:uncharacterized zinc-type alcohol dehydrogenase-like protein